MFAQANPITEINPGASLAGKVKDYDGEVGSFRAPRFPGAGLAGKVKDYDGEVGSFRAPRFPGAGLAAKVGAFDVVQIRMMGLHSS